MKNSVILQQILDKSIDKKKIFGTSFAIKHGNDLWYGSAGNIFTEQQYFIASTTKLFITAIILKLESSGRLELTDNISKHLERSIMDGLHICKGVEYSGKITIKQLLAHTSGLPDYFEDEDNDGNSLKQDVIDGNDLRWTFEESIILSKTLKPQFVPGQKKKAYYSDTNYQLLGKIIENSTGKLLVENLNTFIIEPLGLTSTYLYKDDEDTRPKTLYYKKSELHIPQAMASFGPDGGIVSTSKDMLVFIEAFFTGKLFPQTYIQELQQWNNIFFPLQSGIGIHRLKLPWFFDPTGSVPELIGHSGLSGALAYYSPKEDLYIAGTVNQVAHPDMSFKTAIKLIQKALKK